MLKGFFGDLKQQVHRYGRFMQEIIDLFTNPTRQPVREHDEARIDAVASAIVGKPEMFKQEIESVFLFLQETRIAKQMRNADERIHGAYRG